MTPRDIPRCEKEAVSSRPLILWMAGMSWDGHAGTEVRLARALGEVADVIWFDPVVSWMRSKTLGGRGSRRRVVAPGVLRVTTTGPPGVTRPGFSTLGQRALWRAVVAEGRVGRNRTIVELLSDPSGAFPPESGGLTLYFVTDDWAAGAELMGSSRRGLERSMKRNARRADAVVAVSTELASDVTARTGSPVAVVPNGCEVPAEPCVVPGNRAALVGTINERIDLDVLEAVADRPVEMKIVGPLAARSRDFTTRFSLLVARDNVSWVGACQASEVPTHLAGTGVGLTPYVNSNFNRASFPLKTLEYLAHGLRVVSTPVPANRWLATDLIEETQTRTEFADAVVEALRNPAGSGEQHRRRQFARQHSWQGRAMDLLDVVGLSPASTASHGSGTSATET